MNRYQGGNRGSGYGDQFAGGQSGRQGGYAGPRTNEFGQPGDFLPWGEEARPEYGYSGGIDEGFGFYGRPGIGSQAYDQGRGASRGFGAASNQGPHSGRGPKGYQRSDDRIREEVCDRLTDHPDIDPTEFSVQVQNGEVTLSGFVDDRRQKRMAEDTALSVPGVKDVQNQLRVHEHATDATGAGTSTGTTTHNGTRATAGSTS